MTFYIVNKNADFQEGRGPMYFLAAYRSKAKALSFILGKEGIFGSRQITTPHTTKDGNVLIESYNGYDLLTVQTVD